MWQNKIYPVYYVSVKNDSIDEISTIFKSELLQNFD